MRKIMIGFMVIVILMMSTMPVMASNNLSNNLEELETTKTIKINCFETAGRKIDAVLEAAGQGLSNGAIYIGEKLKVGTGYALSGVGQGLECITSVDEVVIDWLISMGQELKG